MATRIKDTPTLGGKDAIRFLDKLVNNANYVSKEELEKRNKNFNYLESIRKFQ